MTIGISTSIREDRLQMIVDAIDGGADEYNGAFLFLYAGTRPETGGAETDLVAEFTLPYPCGTITDGVLEFDTIEDVISLMYGVVEWARIVDADDNFVMDLSVTATGGGGDVTIDYTEIYEGASVSCTLATITEGNI
jgi:hypothetical protein